MVDTAAMTQSIIGQIHLAEQLDALHLDLVTLRDLSHEGELDLLLEQSGKSQQQKTLYLEKIIAKLLSPELKSCLKNALHEGSIELFNSKQLPAFLDLVRGQAEAIIIVKMAVAVQFKPDDLREMAQVLAEKIGQQTAFDLEVDKSLIGGAVIRSGNYISDYSLKTRLDQFRGHWEKAVV